MGSDVTCRTFQCSPPATTMWFQSSILWRSLDEFRKRSPTNGSRFFLIWTHRWLKKCLQGCSWNRVRPNHWWFQTEERRLKGVLQSICHWHGMYMRKSLTLNSPNWIFFLKEFSLEMGVHFQVLFISIWKNWSSKECSCGHQCGRTLHVGRGRGESGHDHSKSWPGIFTMNLWLKKNKSQVAEIGERESPIYDKIHSVLLQKDGWVARSFLFCLWGASGCLHLVQSTLCGCQYGGWKLKGWCESIFSGAAAFKQVLNSTGRCQLPTKKPRGVFFCTWQKVHSLKLTARPWK